MSLTFNSNIDKFLSNFDEKIDKSLNRIGKIGKDNIVGEAPKDTGYMASTVDFMKDENTIFFTVDAEYAPYVEFGTYKQRANPFMRRGINKSKSDFLNNLIRELRI